MKRVANKQINKDRPEDCDEDGNEPQQERSKADAAMLAERRILRARRRHPLPAAEPAQPGLPSGVEVLTAPAEEAPEPQAAPAGPAEAAPAAVGEKPELPKDQAAANGEVNPFAGLTAGIQLAGDADGYWRKKIKAVYQQCNPQKLAGIDALLQKYVSNEAVLYAKVCKTYGVDPATGLKSTGDAGRGAAASLATSKAAPEAEAATSTTAVVSDVGPTPAASLAGPVIIAGVAAETCQAAAAPWSASGNESEGAQVAKAASSVRAITTAALYASRMSRRLCSTRAYNTL